jgi:hypothetical protein
MDALELHSDARWRQCCSVGSQLTAKTRSAVMFSHADTFVFLWLFTAGQQVCRESQQTNGNAGPTAFRIIGIGRRVAGRIGDGSPAVCRVVGIRGEFGDSELILKYKN